MTIPTIVNSGSCVTDRFFDTIASLCFWFFLNRNYALESLTRNEPGDILHFNKYQLIWVAIVLIGMVAYIYELLYMDLAPIWWTVTTVGAFSIGAVIFYTGDYREKKKKQL